MDKRKKSVQTKIAKDELKETMRSRVRHHVEDMGNGILYISTGNKYAVKVKVLGHYKPRKNKKGK